MKNSIVFILLLCLSVAVCSCSAMRSEDTGNVVTLPEGDDRVILTINSTDDYTAFLNTTKLPQEFVMYEEIKELGNFLGFVVLSEFYVDDYSSYMYNLRDSSGYVLSLHIDHDTLEETIGSSSPITKVNSENMRILPQKSSGTYVDQGLVYRYVNGELLAISWTYEGVTFTLGGSSMFSDYPSTEATFAGKLLNGSKAATAFETVFGVEEK